MIRTVDLTEFGSLPVTQDTISIPYASQLSSVIMPTANGVIRYIQIGISSALSANQVLTSLDLTEFSTIHNLFLIGLNKLQTLTYNSTLAMGLSTSTFEFRETLLRNILPFDVNFHPNGTTSYYLNTVIPNVLTSSDIDSMIDNIYTDKSIFNNTGTKSIGFSSVSGAYTLTGILQAPTGYIQADAVTVGNDGTPATPLEKIYVLINQNNDNTVVKKYKWSFTY